MNSEEIIARLEALTKILKSKQQEIDKKTKDAEAYKLNNEKLTKIVKYVVAGFVIMFLSALLLIGYTIHKYYQYESNTITTTEHRMKEFNTDGGGVIINESEDVSDITSDNGSK